MKRLFTLLITVLALGFTNKTFATLTVTINNRTQAQINMSDPVAVCVGADAYFFYGVVNNPPANPYTIDVPAWSGTAAAHISDPNAPFISFNCLIPGTYYLTFSATKTGFGTYQVTQPIIVYDKDDLYLDFPTVSPYNSCEGTPITFEASGTVFYYWERVNDSQGIGFASSVDEVPPGVGSWTYRIYGFNEGCPTDPEFIEFEVIVEQAATVNAGGPYEVCTGTSVPLNGSFGGSAISVEWIGGLGNFNPNRNDPNAAYTPHPSEAGTTVNLLLRTNDPPGVCEAVEDLTTVTVYQQPTANAGPNGFSCSFNYILAAVPSAGTGTWTQFSGPGVAVFANPNSPASGVTVNQYGTYVFIWTEVNGICSDDDDVTVNFFEQPDADAGLDNSTCGLTISLAATPSVGIGTWTRTSGPGNANFANPNLATTSVTVDAYGTYVFRWTEVNGSCSDFDEVSIQFFQQPIANAGSGGNSCNFEFTLNAVASVGTGTWTKKSGSGSVVFANPNSPSTLVTVGQYDTYEFTWTEVNGICSDTDDVTVNFYEQPVANAGPNAQTCGLTIALGATPSVGTGVWTRTSGPGAANFANPNSPTSNVTVTAYGQHVFRWTETNGTCSDFDEVTVDFFQQPIANAGPDNETCGLSIGLAAVPSAGLGTWTRTSGSGAANFANPNDPTTTVTVTAYGTHVFRWTEVDGICSDSDEVSITFYQQPIANAGPDNQTCGLTISLGAIPSVGTGTWTLNSGPGAANFANPNSPTSSVTVTVYGTYIFTWTEVNGTCAPSSDNVTINFYEQPNADAGPDNQTCGLTISLAATPSVGTGTWTRTSGPGAANFTNSNSPTSSVTVTAYGTYIFRWTEVNGICTDFDEVTVGFFQQPIANAGPDGFACSLTYNLAAVPSVGTGTWTKASGSGNAVFSNPNSPTSSVTVDAYDTYVFTWTEVNGICSDDDDVTVNFYQQPDADAGPDNSTCGLTIALAATPSVGIGTWTQTSGPGIPNFTNANSPTSNVTVTLYGTYILRWTEVNGSCSDFDEVTINFFEQPVADAGIGGSTCGLTFNLGAIPSVGVGTWTYTGPGIATFTPNANTPNANVSVTQYGNYTFTWTEVNGICTSDDDVLVSFFEQPISEAGPDQQVCGQSATMAAIPSVGTGTWTLSSGPGVANYTNANDPTTSVSVNAYGTYIFRWTEVNNICTDFDEVTIEFFETPVANAGPDGDACGFNYTLNAVASVGTGVWTYTGPGTANFSNTNDPAATVTVSALGMYTFTWTETNGICIDSDDVDVNFYQISISVDITNAICFGEDNGTITITATGGVGSYVYSIYGEFGPFEPGNVFNVVSGFYEIWVMDDNGCVAEYPGNPVYIDEPEKIIFDYTVINIFTCFGAAEGSIIISDVSGGTGNYQYSIMEPPVWGANPNFTNLPGGPSILYYIRVRDDSGCVVTGNNGLPVTIDQPAEITFNTTPTHVTGCWYNTNGSILVSNVTGGTGLKWVSINNTGIWYLIPNPSSTRVFANLGVGDHIIRVRDRNNGPNACEVTRVVTILGPPPIQITNLDQTNNICFGDSNGEIDVTATGGTGALSYSLLFEGNPYAGPQPTGLFTNLPSGNYTIEIRDANSCLLTENVTITSPDELDMDIDIDHVDCSYSGPEGVLSVTGVGGTAPYVITLFLGGIQQDQFTNVPADTEVRFENLAGGTDYEVTIDDANNCGILSSGFLTVIVPEILEFNPLSLVVEDLTCNGVPTGTITIAAQGGTLPYTYTLFDAGNNQVGSPIVANNTVPVQFVNLLAGIYTVEVDDGNSCGPVASAPITIIEPDAIEIDLLSILITHISCFGADDGEISLVATGGTGDLYYTITQAGVPVPGFSTQTNNGTFAPLEPGTYVIVVTDDEGCGPVLSAELTVDEPDALDISTVVTDALCFGENGSFQALASNGTPPYTYVLETDLGVLVDTQNGGVDEWVTFSNLAPGNYVLAVSDANSCQNSVPVVIGEPVEVEVSITFFNHPTCDSEGNSTPGIIVAEATGGSGTYTYYLYRNLALLTSNATGIFDNLSAGDYYIEVYDSNNCGPAITSTVTLDNPTDIVIDDILVTDVLCFGGSNGEIEVIVSNALGTPLFTITAGNDDWQTSNIFTGLAAGDYIVRVKDDNNCIVSQSVTIGQPAQLQLIITPTPPTTASDTDGSIQVDVTGGTPNFWYELFVWDNDLSDWVLIDNHDNSGASHTFTNLGVGLYRVVVTDNNGCSTFEDVPLSQFTIILSGTNLLCFESCDGTITVTPVGGTIQTITWEKDGVDFTAEMLANYDPLNEIYNSLCAGVYVAFATDTEGNDATAFIEIFQPTAIEVSFTVVTPDCYTNLPVGSVVFNITGGTPFADGYDITWDGGTVRGFIVDELPEGTYNFIISDENGCDYEVEEIEIVYPEGMTLTILEAYNLFCYDDNSGGISMFVSGGTDPITYQIVGTSGTLVNNNGVFTNLAAGSYEITITDDNGCVHIFEDGNTIEIEQPDQIIITQITPITEPLDCHYDVAGIVEMGVTGGTGDYSFSWSNGQEELDLIDPFPGNYILTVTDENGCIETLNVNIPGPSPFVPSAIVETANCRLAPAGNTGSISVTNIEGGNGTFSQDFNVRWFREGFGNLGLDGLWSISNLQSGWHYGVITDQKLCKDTLYFYVPYDEDNFFTVDIDMEEDYCYFDNAVLTAVALQGSFGASAQFEWYNVTVNPNIIIGTNISYTTSPLTQDTRMLVKVTSSEGCLEQREKTINVYPQIGPFLDRNTHPFFSPSDLITFDGDETVISVLADTEYSVEVLTVNPDYTLTYSWTPAQFFFPPNAKNSTMLFQSGTYEQFLTGQLFNTVTQKNEQYIPLVGQVQSEFGCIETINLKARILDRIRLANVFSPNDDGINDVWMIPYSDLFPDLEIKIYNRWGALVWSAKGTEASKGWKGTNKNGKDLPIGTYYYVISFNVKGSSKWKPVSGSVTIIR